MKPLDQVRAKNPRLVVGLMSGTSCDGVNVAFVEVQRTGEQVRIRLRGFSEFPFEPELRRRLLHLAEVKTSRIDILCETNFSLARTYVEAIKKACRRNRVRQNEIDLIGSHGQTMHHFPAAGSTLQIGEPSVLAEAFHVPVVADFRPRDMAAGGQGAPLVPYVDYLLLRDERVSRAVQNLGGIGNVTFLPAGCSPEQVIAFDTGPGNMVIDGVVRRLSKGEKLYDHGGEWAKSGLVNFGVLMELLRHPFFAAPPPKSTGRETFGARFVENVIRLGKRRKMDDEDIVATVTALTAESMAQAYEEFLLPEGPIHEIILSGGGAFNSALVQEIRDRLPESKVRLSDELGLPVAAKEAICFAVLADETLEGRPNNLPAATGAKSRVVLGKIVLP